MRPDPQRTDDVGRTVRASSLNWLVLSLLVGCGSNSNLPDFHTELVPVTGTVTYQEKPLVNAGVSFLPTGPNAIRGAYGRTDAEGKYSLMTPIRNLTPEESQGAVPGEYRVVISQLKMPDGSAIPDGMTHADAEFKGAKEAIPGKYSHQEFSRLTAVVEKGTPQATLDFDLK